MGKRRMTRIGEFKRIACVLSMTGVLLAAALLSGCIGKDAGKGGGELNVSAAAGLINPLNEIKADYERENPGMKVTINYASSGSLQTQIENGSKTDVFISAAKKNMDGVEKKNLIASGSRMDLLLNRIALVTPADNDNIVSLESLKDASVKKVALGEPKSVPVGKYADEALKSFGISDAISKKAVYGKSVKEVLTWVETGNVDAGIVYYSDAKGNDKVRIAEVIDEKYHSKVIFPMAMISGSENKDAAKSFMEFLKSPTSRNVFEGYGFTFIGK